MKTEGIVLEMLSDSFVRKKNRFTQYGVSKLTGVAISAVNKTVSTLRKLSIVDVDRTGFKVIDFKRLLLYWATHRDLDRDILYTTRVDAEVREIEGGMPSGIAFTAFTAFKFLVGEPPADYSLVYVYSPLDTLEVIEKRFPPRNGTKNLFVLKGNRYLDKLIMDNGLEHSCVGLPLAFVDLWNIREWYAKEFADKLMEVLTK